MSEENKAEARRFYEEVFNKANVDAIDEFCVPGFVDHTALPGMAPGIEGVKQLLGMYFNAFPDLRITVDEIVAEGDVVVIRSTVTATHTGDLMGIPPTGKPITLRGLDFVRMSGGKATGIWHFEEDMFAQLGVAPPVG